MPRIHRASLLLIVMIGVGGALTINAINLVSRRNKARTEERAPADHFRVAYTVIKQERLYNAKLPPEGQLTSGVYLLGVRSDGSWVYWPETRQAAINGLRSQREIYLSSGVRIVTDELRRLKSSVVYSPPRFIEKRDPNRECMAVTVSGGIDTAEQLVSEDKTVILGYETIALRRAGNTTWFAPALSCAELRHRAMFPGGAVNDQAAIDVIVGDADQRLFSVDGYMEVLPSILKNLSPGSPAALSQDSYYRANRPIGG